jgi:hypothetical protein
MERAGPGRPAGPDSDDGAVPDTGETLSHPGLADAVKASGPVPALLTTMLCAGGAAAPAVAVNDRLAGLAPMGGAGGASTAL